MKYRVIRLREDSGRLSPSPQFHTPAEQCGRRNFPRSGDKPGRRTIRIAAGDSTEGAAGSQDFALHRIPLVQAQQYGRNVCVGLAAFDTLLLPARDCEEIRADLFQRRQWRPVRIHRSKLPHLSYLAVCFGPPADGVTHYAKLTGCIPSGEAGKYILHFEPPVELPHRLGLSDPAQRPRAPRYTTLSLLLECSTLDELFV